MKSSPFVYSIVSICFVSLARCIELTFELPDNANQCFFEDIKENTDCTIEMQVVTGGQYDVDMKVQGPNDEVLYQDVRKQYDSFNFKTKTAGTYKVCFSNEFSTFSHKIVYLDWMIGDEKPLLPNMNKHISAMSYLESSAEGIHDRLKRIDDLQTHHRLREATGRKRAEDLNERVMWWSIGQTALVLICGIGQVFVLRSFFTEKRTSAF